MFSHPRRRGAAAALALLTAATLSACSGSSTPGTASSGSTTPNASTAAKAGLTVADAWAKANTDIAKSPMTGVFAKITNGSTSPVTIVSAKNSASAVTELHETVMKDGAMVMQPVKDGFVIEAGKTRELKPGSDHIMVMKMTKPLAVGDKVTVTLSTKDGGSVEFTAVAKQFTMGSEPYVTGGATASTSMTH